MTTTKLAADQDLIQATRAAIACLQAELDGLSIPDPQAALYAQFGMGPRAADAIQADLAAAQQRLAALLA